MKKYKVTKFHKSNKNDKLIMNLVKPDTSQRTKDSYRKICLKNNKICKNYLRRTKITKILTQFLKLVKIKLIKMSQIIKLSQFLTKKMITKIQKMNRLNGNLEILIKLQRI